MNAELENTLSTNLSQTIQWIKEIGSSAQNSAVEQIPLYCREVVMWEFYSSLLFVVLGLLMILTPSLLIYFSRKWIKADLARDGCISIAGIVVSCMSLVIGSIITVKNSSSAVKAQVAPRLVLIDHLKTLIR